jgi:ankyrin repeat protein
VRELLACGANVNAAANSGATPLIQASWRGHVEVVRALLSAGADKHLMLHNGATATSLAGTKDDAPPGSRAAILALLATPT